MLFKIAVVVAILSVMAGLVASSANNLGYQTMRIVFSLLSVLFGTIAVVCAVWVILVAVI